jgi:hypothetical protein
MDDEEDYESSMLFGNIFNEDEFEFVVDDEELVDTMRELAYGEFLVVYSDLIREQIRDIMITFSDKVIIRYRDIP